MVDIKSKLDVERMKVAGKLASDVLVMIEPYVTQGISTEELDQICHDYIVNKQKAIPAPLNYKGFPKSICTSVNHQVCHGIPDKRILKKQDILNIDITVIKDGYHGDTSKMFFVGKPSIQAKRLVELTYDALKIGIKTVKPGATIGDIGHNIQVYAEKNHCSVVREYCGHGIGKEFHEEPQILHYGKPGKGTEILEGMCFTIEPMINQGSKYCKTLQDGWTVETKDGRNSAQWEHTLAVTKNGVEVLTKRHEESI